MQRRYRDVVLLSLIAAAVFLTNLGGYDLWPADEPRFAEVAREMMDSGDYLSPRVNGEPYNEKPPLLFWCIAAASWPFGEVTAFSARAPSALAGILTVLMTYALARRLYGARVAWWSAIILLTCMRFWWQARTAQIDMLLTACMTAALYAFWRWDEARKAGWLVAFYGAIAAGVYAKGPPALVFPLLLAIAFYWGQREQRRRAHLFMGITAVAVLIALWLIPARMAVAGQGGAAAQDAVAGNLFRQIVGRAVLGVSKAQPPWYYLTTLPVDWFPWVLFAPWAIPWVWRHRKEDRGMRLLLSWSIPALIFFSIIVGKRAIYILPIFPTFAILSARSILDLMQSGHTRWRRLTAWVWALLLFVIAAAPFSVLATEYAEAWSPALVIMSIHATAFAVITIVRAVKTETRKLHIQMAFHFAALTAFVALLAFPAMNTHRSARGFCAPLRALSETSEDYRLYSVGFSREEYIFYARHFHIPVFTDILPVELPPGVSPEDNAEMQVRLRRAVAKAVQRVEVSDFETVSSADIESLHEAVAEVLDGSGLAPEYIAAYKKTVTEAVNAFGSEFRGAGPAFLFVQEHDWRWLLALAPELRDCAVIRHRGVGSRSVLLISNTEGAAKLNEVQS